MACDQALHPVFEVFFEYSRLVGRASLTIWQFSGSTEMACIVHQSTLRLGTLFPGNICDGVHTQRDDSFDVGAEVEVKAMLRFSGEERGYVDPCICMKSFSLEAGQGWGIGISSLQNQLRRLMIPLSGCSGIRTFHQWWKNDDCWWTVSLDCDTPTESHDISS